MFLSTIYLTKETVLGSCSHSDGSMYRACIGHDGRLAQSYAITIVLLAALNLVRWDCDTFQIRNASAKSVQPALLPDLTPVNVFAAGPYSGTYRDERAIQNLWTFDDMIWRLSAAKWRE